MTLKMVILMLTQGYNVPPSLPPTTSWTELVSTLYSNPATVTCRAPPSCAPPACWLLNYDPFILSFHSTLFYHSVLSFHSITQSSYHAAFCAPNSGPLDRLRASEDPAAWCAVRGRVDDRGEKVRAGRESRSEIRPAQLQHSIAQLTTAARCLETEMGLEDAAEHCWGLCLWVDYLHIILPAPSDI